jgi:hypothetical protein
VLPLVRSSQQVPQLRAQAKEPLLRDWAQVSLASRRPVLELQEWEQPQETPQALEHLASKPAAMPLLSRNAPQPQPQLLVPPRPLGVREPSPPLPLLRNWSAFSFPLRQNPATGQ